MNVKLLIVDDEEQIRIMLENHFSLLGYDVRTAQDGCDAIKVLEKEKIDIVVSDIRMPNMSGDELCARIRSDFPLTRVIMITGYVNMESALACLRRGADSCLFKPFEDLTELESAVKNSVGILQHWILVMKRLNDAKAGATKKEH